MYSDCSYETSSVFETSSVIIHVYDIFKFNNYIDRLGFGVYHTGIEVYGTEYCYGGHPHDYSGIFPMEPRNMEMLGDDYTFKTSLAMGKTDFTENDVRQILITLGKQFCGIDYNLLKKNCNHFSGAFLQILLGQTLPKWINRLAETSSQIPFIEKIIPKEWLRPQDYMDDESDVNSMYVKSFYYPIQPSESSSEWIVVDPSTGEPRDNPDSSTNTPQ